MEPVPGKKCTRQAMVDEARTAVRMGSGSLRVLATPALAALVENAAAACVALYCAPGQTTVGTKLTLAHTAPTPVGMRFWAEATLTGARGRVFTFDVRAYDESGEIGMGTHERVLVSAQSFQQKADAKGAEA